MEESSEIEKCPKCGSTDIQYDGYSDELYCLIVKCGYRWKQEIDIDKIKNDDLLVSIPTEKWQMLKKQKREAEIKNLQERVNKLEEMMEQK